ncbi:MAG: ferritin [Treponema sp.]|jgi:ferritin|nr:ferritin [Treponema sp.]
MIKESISRVLSEQVNEEYYSAYLYLAMSAYADRSGFKGAAHWLFVQAREETAHANHLYQYILERGAAPSLTDIKASQLSFESITAVFEKVLAHERHVSELLNRIAALALDENDHAAYTFIQWYVNEQVEEEANADEILTQAKAMRNDAALLYQLDAQLAKRKFIDPFPEKD